MNRTRITRIQRKFTDKISGNLFNLCSSVFYFFFCFVLLLFITNCTSSLTSLYDFDFPLTSSTAKSISSSYQIAVPQGWFIAEDNECNCTDIWLIDKTYSSTIKFKLINIDSITRAKISDEPQKLAEYSKLFVKVKFGSAFKGFTNEESFENNGIIFYAYEYNDDEKRTIRTVVFSYKDKSYESTAIPVKSISTDELFKVQNTVMASIK